MKEVVKNKVQSIRIKEGITQKELAVAIGATRQTVIAIEKGNYTPSVLLALKISKFFNVPTENIFGIK